MPSKKVYIETYGCQMNVLDSDLVRSQLADAGFAVSPDKENADVILFNTCSVRRHAEERVLSNAGKTARLKKKKPGLLVGIIGCMAECRREEILESLPHVQLIVGPRKLGAIPRLIAETWGTGERRVVVRDADDEFIDGADSIDSRAGRSQAYVKVMEGCDMKCSFCVVPRARGREVSRPPEAIVEEVRRLAGGGCVEVTLLGQAVNSYGKGLKPRTDLGALLRRVHDEAPDIRRIRFITSYPSLMRAPLIEAMRDLPRVCRYLHIPVQSGSTRILKAMRRGYTRERFVEIVGNLRDRVPGVEIATDFIVGFPGETEEDFEASASLVREVEFQNCFVFKYSPRPGTEAAGFDDDVPEAEKKRRNNALLDAQKEIAQRRNQRHVGKRVEVLVEGPSKSRPERLTGRTDTWQIVNFDADGRGDLAGKFAEVEIVSATALSLSGRIA